jgi:hypothetical protein
MKQSQFPVVSRDFDLHAAFLVALGTGDLNQAVLVIGLKFCRMLSEIDNVSKI